MSKIEIGKGLLVFLATTALGFLFVWLYQPETSTTSIATKPTRIATSQEPAVDRTGTGMSGPGDSGCYPRCPTLEPDGASVPPAALVTSPLKITAKPKAQYTDAARAQDVQGVVRLKIALLANGSVGSITPINELPFGLTEQAIAAARQIKFEPRRVNGVPQTAIVTFEYSFTIY